METKNNKTYRSPKRKLVRFFEKSRDQWKAKYLEIKKVIKRQQNRIRFLERSKEQYQEKVRALEAQLDKLQAAHLEKERKIEELKKISRASRGSDYQ